MRVKFGARLPVTGPFARPENIVKVGMAAEELGFDAVTTHDHVSEGRESRYHNSGGIAELVDERERQGLSVNDIYETMSTLTYIAGKTSKVRLIPCAVVLPWRQPFLFAKQAVTLNELSSGRFVCAVVVGNIATDFAAMNVEFKKRGRIMDEYLKVLQLLFESGGRVTYEGDHVKFQDVSFEPRASKRITIWIGGSFNDIVHERIANYGEGFIAGGSPEMCREGIARLEQTLKKRGRTLSSVEMGVQTFMCLMPDSAEAQRRARHTVESFYSGDEWRNQDIRKVSSAMNDALLGSPAEVTTRIERYAEVGISFFDVRMLNTSIDEVLAMMRLFAKEVMPSFT